MVLVIGNFAMKGGVGKTSSIIINLELVKELNKKALCIDMDLNAKITKTYFKIIEPKKTILDVLNGNSSPKDAVIKFNDNIDVIPGTVDLAGYDFQLGGELGTLENASDPKKYLKKYFSKINRFKEQNFIDLFKEYDYVFIDALPNLGIIALIILSSTDVLVMPAKMDEFDTSSIKEFWGKLNWLAESHKIKIKKLFFLPFAYDGGSEHLSTISFLTSSFPDNVLKPVPYSKRIRKALGKGMIEWNKYFLWFGNFKKDAQFNFDIITGEKHGWN